MANIITKKPSAKTLVESIRSMGYSFDTAIADIIDNSVSANATRIDINLYLKPDYQISIIDNGNGMNRDQLEEAMRYGSSNPREIRRENDLGRFGLGMKSASLSQCRKLIVTSKYKGNISSFSWDLDLIESRDDWALIEYDDLEIRQLKDINLLENHKSGTMVSWYGFDKLEASAKTLDKALPFQLDNAKNYISLVFHRYIHSGLEIYVNNIILNTIDPFLQNHPLTIRKREQKIDVDGHYIYVKPYILPHSNALSIADVEKLGGKD